MKISILTLGLLPMVVVAGGLETESIQERGEGLSPKLGASMEEHALRAVENMFEPSKVVARMPAPEPQAVSAAGSAAATSDLPPQAGTNSACQAQLAKLNGIPSNPSGKAACWNVADLNNSTGTFLAQVLIYDIGLPTGQWVNLLGQAEQIALQYPGGTVQPGLTQHLALPPSDGSSPALNASLLFTCNLNSTMLGQLNNANAMRAALTPQITIGAETSDGQFLNVTMANGEAALINGPYSSQSYTATTAEAAAAIGTPFVLPGTTLGIFPTGLIITLAWTVFFFVTVGLGTFGRYQFRSAYRSRNAGLGARSAGGVAYEKR